MKSRLCILVTVLSLSAVHARADLWDAATDNDDSSATKNELIHGSNQTHDLGLRPKALDEDWYAIGQRPYSSYEIVVDATSGDIGVNVNLLQRVSADGTNVFQTAAPVTPELNFSHSLRWANTGGKRVVDEYIRVGPGQCGKECSSQDRYQIRAMETTIYVARFNNSDSQLTVLLAQNASEEKISATVFYWDAAGTLVAQSDLSLGAKQLAVVSTSEVPGLAGMSGSITIAHDAPYGQLNVKMVALEPATGFSFDSPGVYRGF
jgi:hypothetical protein